MAIEIERKYQVSPDVVRYMPKPDKEYSIVQVYLETQSDFEVRVRSKNYSYFMTVKTGSGLVRTEYEVCIDEVDFRRLAVGKPYLRKTRKVFGEWELDFYTPGWNNLVIAEIELQSPETPVVIPDWLRGHIYREVTGNAAFANRNLCTLDFQWPKF